MVAGAAFAQSDFPSKPIRYVVPLPPGGGADFIARLVADKMSADLGRPIIVENRSGASGAIGSDFVAKSPPDGYTVLQCYVVTHGTNPAVSKLPYDAVKDFTPIGMIAATSNVLVVNDKAGVKTLQELIAVLRAKPKGLSFASTGVGSATHLTMEYLEQQAGIDLVHVPYKGAGPAMTDLLGGQVEAMFPSLITALPHVRSGKLRALALSAAQRSPQLPEVPHRRGVGLPGVQCGAVVRGVRTGRRAADDRRATEQGAQRSDHESRRPNEAGRPGGGRDADVAGRVRGLHPRRHRTLGEAPEGHEPQDRTMNMPGESSG